MVLLPPVGDVDDFVGTEPDRALKHGGEVGGGIVAGPVRFAHDERLGGEAGVLRVENHESPVVLARDPVLRQLCVDLTDLFAVVALAQYFVETHAQAPVNGVEGLVAHPADQLPQVHVLPVAPLQFEQLGPGRLQRGRVLPGQRATLLVEPLEVFQRVGVGGGGIVALALDGEDENAKLCTPVADVVVAHHLRPAKGQQAGDGFADDGRADVANVHLLGGVGRTVVHHRLPARVQVARAPAKVRPRAMELDPAIKKARAQAKIDETRPGQLQVDRARVEPAGTPGRLDQPRAEFPRVAPPGLGVRQHAVGLEVAEPRLRRTHLRIKVRAKPFRLCRDQT